MPNAPLSITCRIHGSSSLLLFRVSEDVRFKVSGLGELLVAAVEGTNVGPVTRVDPYVRAKVEVQREPLATALERALKRLYRKEIKICI